MKTGIYLLLAATFLLNSSFSPFVSKPRFEVEILQDDDFVDAEEKTVELQKGPFTIRVKIYGMEGVFLNASTESSLFDLEASDPVPDYNFIPSKTMVVEQHNTDKDLILSKGYYHYLTDITGEGAFHTFNKAEHGDGFFTGWLEIEKFTEKGSEKETSASKMKKPVYLFFLGMDADKKEIGRYKLKIDWE